MNNTNEETNEMTITLEARNVYGNTLYYPVCKLAEQFTNLIGSTTVPYHKMSTIRNMGVQIEVVSFVNGMKFISEVA